MARYFPEDPFGVHSCEGCGADIPYPEAPAEGRVYNRYCTDCIADKRRNLPYGTTHGLRESMYEAHGSACWACGREEDANVVNPRGVAQGKDPVIRRLDMDWDVDTGRIRGLLCAQCSRDLHNTLGQQERFMTGKARKFLAHTRKATRKTAERLHAYILGIGEYAELEDARDSVHIENYDAIREGALRLQEERQARHNAQRRVPKALAWLWEALSGRRSDAQDPDGLEAPEGAPGALVDLTESGEATLRVSGEASLYRQDPTV